MSEAGRFVAELVSVPEGGAAGIAVDADLRLELTAAGARTSARVTGHGRRVRVDAARPDVLLAAVDRGDVGRVADLLAATGITVDVHGPRGSVAALGAGAAGRVGRVLTGSRHVAVVPRGAWWVVRSTRPVRGTAVVLSVALVVLAAARAVGYGAGPGADRIRDVTRDDQGRTPTRS